MICITSNTKKSREGGCITSRFKSWHLIIKLPYILLVNIILKRHYLGLVLFRSQLRVFKITFIAWTVQMYKERFSWMNEKGIKIGKFKRQQLLKTNLATAELILTNDYLGEGIDPYNSNSKFELMAKLNDYREIKLKSLGYSKDFNILGPEWVAAIGHISHSILFPKLFKNREKIFNFYSKSANSTYLNLLEPFINYVRLPEDIKEVMDLYFFGGKTSMNAVRITKEIALKVREFGMSLKGLDVTLHEALTIAEYVYRTEHGSSPFFYKPFMVEENKNRLVRLIKKSRADYFVTLHVRNSVTSFVRGANNANIFDYVDSINWLASQGILTIRLGDPSMPKLNIDSKFSRFFIDYAHSDMKSASNDIYLLSNCKFLIGTSSGPGFVPNDFGVPTLLTNSPMIGLTPLIRGYFIPHLFQDRKNGRILSLTEMYNSEVGWKNPLSYKNYLRIKNSPVEILNGVKKLVEEQVSLANCKEDRIKEFEELRRPFNVSSAMAIEPNFLNNHSYLI